MISLMFTKWEYPLWDSIGATGKITKYNLWYLLMMSGQVKVDKNQISFATDTKDIGFIEEHSEVLLPAASDN